MNQSKGRLLNSRVVNELRVGGELAWFIRDVDLTTGLSWRFTPDNSGVYEEVERVDLHGSSPKGHTGTPGAIIWQFKAVRQGEGALLFELFPAGSEKPKETIQVQVNVRS